MPCAASREECALTTERWKKRPAGSNWGDFGPDDQKGRLNLLTPERVRAAVAEVREGQSFCLSLPLDYPGGNAMNANRHPPILRPSLRNGGVNMNYVYSAQNAHSHDVLSDDLAILHLQYSTQWDGLCHVGAVFDVMDDENPLPVYYNGFRAGTDVIAPTRIEDCGLQGRIALHSTSGARALGIENMAATGVQGRGTMIDLRRHFGDARTVVGHDLLMQVIMADGIEVAPGDMLCLHTGLADMILDMRQNPDPAVIHSSCAVLDGGDRTLQDWIRDSGISVIASDNYAVESFPADLPNPCCSILRLNNLCLFRLGIHLGELWHMTPLAEWLAARGRHHFLLTAPPLRRGAAPA
ncbi:cyclase family protein [Haematobacter genomosp. 1]|uniref:cyclase family protein n=1 Tax=Haematobacter genomosp. 1 TaxID=366618 RepID=UPI001C52B489|nr:cyclase family protein [Haematobacter genomosp. 1]